jgi:hypothetical protein
MALVLPHITPLPNLTKQCSKCKEAKNLTEFYKNRSKRDGHTGECKACCKLRHRVWRDKNPSYQRTWRYGISLDEYTRLFAAQNGVCAICGQAEKVQRNKKLWSLAVDHAHTTKQIRGLLCSRCNTAVGLLQDSVQNALKVAEYLLKYAQK